MPPRTWGDQELSWSGAGAVRCSECRLRVCSPSWADPPRVPVLTSFLESPEGQRGVLQCTVDSSPRAELALFKDEALVASTALPQPTIRPRLIVSSAFNTLRVIISPVLLEDEGEYVCAASNTYGNSSTAANFTAGSECHLRGDRQGMGWDGATAAEERWRLGVMVRR